MLLTAAIFVCAFLAAGCSTQVRGDMLTAPVEQLPVIADRAWNASVADVPLLAFALWYLILSLLGVCAWPIAASLLPDAADGGHAAARGSGLLLAGYLLWMGASLRVWPNTALTAWCVVAVLLIAALVLGWSAQHTLLNILRRSWRFILGQELLFLVLFGLFAALRLWNPDLWHPIWGGEKTMELGILNALTRSAYMPPYDPFFSGGALNYYYYGHFLCSTLLKLTGLPPEVGFNLSVPTFAALLGLLTFNLGAVLAGSRFGRRGFAVAGGVCSLVAVLFLSNLNVLVQCVAGAARAGGASLAESGAASSMMRYVLPGVAALLRGKAQLPAFDYWTMATRIIPNTINEFPLFTYLFADLHPHLIAMPFTVLVLILAINLARAGHTNFARRMALGVLLALTLGALGPANTWDFPTYAALMLVFLTLSALRTGGWRSALRGFVAGCMVGVLALLLYLPYYRGYQAPPISPAWIAPLAASPAPAWLVVWGWQLLLSISFIVMEWRGKGLRLRLAGLYAHSGWRRGLCRWLRLGGRGVRCMLAAAWVCLVSLPLIVIVALRFGALPALLVPMVTAGILLLLLPAEDDNVLCRRLLLAAGWLILCGIEVFYLRDHLAGSEWRRMNTVFKFGLQTWVLLGIALGSVFPAMWARAVHARRWGIIWRFGVVGLLIISASYAPLAVPVRAAERFSDPPPSGTFDGSAFMRDGVYYWPDAASAIELRYDWEAIRWLNGSIRGTPVMAEAALGYYREFGGRVAAYTGLPTLTGAHAAEQHLWDQVRAREQAVAALYGTTDEDRFWSIVREYQVRYIYVGQLERAAYPGPGLDKFGRLAESGRLELVFANERTEIYYVPGKEAD